MRRTKTKKSGGKTGLKTAASIMMLFAASLLISSTACYQQKYHFIPQAELGEIDYYGEIPYGEIPAEVYERIKDKKVEAVSKGFLDRYKEMKELLEDLGEWKWEE